MVLVIGAAVVHEGRLLAARRTRPEEVAGGWELPGGKVEPGEDPAYAVVREVAEELGCEIEVTGFLDGEVAIKEGYALRVAVARLRDGEPVPREGEHDAVRWLAPEELESVPWLVPDRPFLPALRELLLDGLHLDGGPLLRTLTAWTQRMHDAVVARTSLIEKELA